MVIQDESAGRVEDCACGGREIAVRYPAGERFRQIGGHFRAGAFCQQNNILQLQRDGGGLQLLLVRQGVPESGGHYLRATAILREIAVVDHVGTHHALHVPGYPDPEVNADERQKTYGQKGTQSILNIVQKTEM